MRILFLSLAAALGTTSAFGWGCEGHQMIALMARQQLKPAASAAVDKLLKENREGCFFGYRVINAIIFCLQFELGGGYFFFGLFKGFLVMQFLQVVFGPGI